MIQRIKSKIAFLFALITMIFFSCEKNFLEKPDTTGTLDLETIYSSRLEAKKALMSAYHQGLIANWPMWPMGGIPWAGALGGVSGERAWGMDWHLTVTMVKSGPSSTFSTERYQDNWIPIRKAYLVYDNIYRVPDMTEEEKDFVKGECLGIVAYRYLNMFIHYGGLPIVVKAFDPDDDLKLPRASLEETLAFTLKLCDDAEALLPNSWPPEDHGRLTKGVAKSIKARLLTYAARPLFNSETPYLQLGDKNDLICFGNKDMRRYEEAVKANEDVIEWALKNGYNLINTGGAGLGQPNPNALSDYGTATSVPANKEVLLAFKDNSTYTSYNVYYNSANTQKYNGWEIGNAGLLTQFLRLYYLKDGSTPDWPKVGEATPRTVEDFSSKVDNMESRFRLDYVIPGYGTLNNPGISAWTLQLWFPQTTGNYAFEATDFPNAADVGKGMGLPAKFYYKAGNRGWFEAPLFRMAEFYLNLAEAYNELSNTTKALENLNKVHNRAGLPSISETDQSKLRALIWREKAIEFVGENRRYFDVKHWKHPDIDKGIIGGQFSEIQIHSTTTDKQLLKSFKSYWDANTYVGYWHPKMYLSPFPQEEVNKGVLIQNPGF